MIDADQLRLRYRSRALSDDQSIHRLPERRAWDVSVRAEETSLFVLDWRSTSECPDESFPVRTVVQ